MVRRALVALTLAGVFLSLGESPPVSAALFNVNSTVDEHDVTPGDGVCLTAAGQCTLRAAVEESNALPGPDSIDLPAGQYTFAPTGFHLSLKDDVTITGAGTGQTVINASRPLPEFGPRAFLVECPVVAEISHLSITGTIGSFGGGITNLGNLTLFEVALTHNAVGLGGAIDSATNGCVPGGLTISHSTISNNIAVFGGGLRNAGPMTLTNVTISGNEAAVSGGAIWSELPSGTLTNVTVASNSAPPGAIGGLRALVEIRNSIVSANTGFNCSGLEVSRGHNISSDSTCDLTATGDLVNTDPEVGPLQSNGGSTNTHALLSGSPAIDAGSPDCPPPTTDQRGVARPQGAACDIGAYEAEALPTPVKIDIKPGDDPNNVNLNERGVIPVAILSEESFDATTVDPSSVCFGDAEAPAERDCSDKHGAGHIEDVSHDGKPDLMLHYETSQSGIDPDDTQACLTGRTFDGAYIEGCGAIRIVLPRRR